MKNQRIRIQKGGKVGFSSVFLGFVVLNSEVVLRQGSVLLENEDGEVGVLCVFVLVKTTIAGTGIKGRKRFGFLSFACSDPTEISLPDTSEFLCFRLGIGISWKPRKHGNFKGLRLLGAIRTS